MGKQKYKNRFYEINVTLPVTAIPDIPVGTRVSGSVNIVNVPFIWTRVTHSTIGYNQALPGAAAVQQIGQYTLEIRTDQHNYQTAPIHAIALGGTPDYWLDLPTPEELEPKTTITVDVTNLILRAEGEVCNIQIVFHGLEPIGDDDEES